MLQIEVICFGLAIEVERLQALTQQLQQDIAQANQLNKVHLNTIDQNSIHIQHLTRKLDELKRNKNQLDSDYNQLKSQHDYVIDIISQITGDELTLEELTELIEELKRRSLKYDEIQELLNGQDINEIISNSEQLIIQHNINQELKDQLEQYPQIVISLNQDIQKQKLEIQNQKLQINQLTQQNSQLEVQIASSQSTLDQRQNSNQLFHSTQLNQQEQNEKQLIELKNKVISLEQQNKWLNEEMQSISNLKIQIEGKLRNSLLDQNKLLSEKEKLAKEAFYLVSISNNFKTQLQNKQATIEELTNEISSLQNQIKNKDDPNEALLKQNKDLESFKQQEINNLNQELSYKTQEIQEISLQNLRLNDEIEKLNEQLKNSLKVSQHSKEFSQQIQIIQDKLIQNKNIMQMQDNHLQLLQQQSMNDKKELQQHYVGIIDKLNGDNFKLKSQLDESQNKINKLEDQLVEVQSEFQEIKDLLDSKQVEILKLSIINKKIQESNEKYLQQNQELEEQNRQLQFKYSSSQKSNQESSRSSSDYVKSQILDKLKSENQYYLQDKYKLELQNQELLDQIASMKSEINKYQIQITNLTVQVENAQFQYANEQSKEISSYKQQLQQTTKQINQLQQRTEQQTLTIQQQNTKIQQFENDYFCCEEKFKLQILQIQEKEFFIRELQQELHLYSNQIKKMEKELNILQIDNENKIQENNDLTKYIDNLRTESKFKNEQINTQQLHEVNIYNSELQMQIQQLNEQISQKCQLLEQKCQLIDKFNLKIMNQNVEICQLKQQLTIQQKQIRQFENNLQTSEQIVEIEQIDNKKMNEITQLNIKLSKVIDEKEQKILQFQQQLQVKQDKLQEMEQIHSKTITQQTEQKSLFQSRSNQFLKSKISSETLFSQNIEDDPYQKLLILQKKYNDILKENSNLIINSHLIEDYKNKIALLSLEVSRYHNSQRGLLNSRENQKQEDNTTNKTKSLSQDKGNNMKTQQYIEKSNKECDLYCLIVLLFAEIESLRAQDDQQKMIDKSKVQRIIDYYRQKPQ
ncbi:unnamed protein product (macronuclear) [Paramecium tetraurelia]|uniref:Uncharacterized protein n=1 Tax=Paramecium tetraurelia TaxID=5888 RepID=A0CTR2_PARTE|nr:uncharacterized protein GSPATT00010413001 [Paramecium tetraurelia]CAK74179.1 unnamed protein product [Paramecium tetraurelia]|eukprot:XP_001441576.1 hypothetical protein (macronuclear) [Paramecium tetraurelia strain d4-2]